MRNKTVKQSVWKWRDGKGNKPKCILIIVQVYILGKKPEGTLARPWKKPNPLEGLIPTPPQAPTETTQVSVFQYSFLLRSFCLSVSRPFLISVFLRFLVSSSLRSSLPPFPFPLDAFFFFFQIYLNLRFLCFMFYVLLLFCLFVPPSLLYIAIFSRPQTVAKLKPNSTYFRAD